MIASSPPKKLIRAREKNALILLPCPNGFYREADCLSYAPKSPVSPRKMSMA